MPVWYLHMRCMHVCMFIPEPHTWNQKAVCVCVCVYVCMNWKIWRAIVISSISVSIKICMYVCMYAYIFHLKYDQDHMYACMHACWHLSSHSWSRPVCMYVCMHESPQSTNRCAVHTCTQYKTYLSNVGKLYSIRQKIQKNLSKPVGISNHVRLSSWVHKCTDFQAFAQRFWCNWIYCLLHDLFVCVRVHGFMCMRES